MLRWIIVLVALLPLAACESDEGWAPDNLWPLAESQSSAAPAQQTEDPHCRQVAYARAADAKANGFDDDIREQIYSGTYADCMDWNRAHPAAQQN